ncbi:hypothetical protein BJY16_006503 [Actinoplanes octamycinicus]|uniref:Uncharacterized protein n=1 Tax=Actinoplanes octamycinicus TaxID=135948 RepID=A0A7W7MAH0_9ACTN|nr:hypothetical protein [Actinoplanes octamycinicus]MBB4743044.1 hypothetical protein [Actinoplanes octamycinicus]GIE58101.1 hypothetical protein Aoc01nite_35030 [Actinoplanes octamycinicus]
MALRSSLHAWIRQFAAALGAALAGLAELPPEPSAPELAELAAARWFETLDTVP